MTHDAMPAYGLWGLVIINTAVFVIHVLAQCAIWRPKKL